eukprot:730259-Pelagomonas_calceolata.AAC.1
MDRTLAQMLRSASDFVVGSDFINEPYRRHDTCVYERACKLEGLRFLDGSLLMKAGGYGKRKPEKKGWKPLAWCGGVDLVNDSQKRRDGSH